MAQRHPIGTTFEGSLEGSSKFEFLYEGLQREPACETGTITGKTTEAAQPLIGEVSAISFSRCAGEVCSVRAQGIPTKPQSKKPPAATES